MRAEWTIRPVVWVCIAAFSFAAFGLALVIAFDAARAVGL